ncbi:hypothetical protein KA405_02170, partial [Patescibacteria group bacterium]|nr:hypothetical protein [Patescibacteria group bacterium]
KEVKEINRCEVSNGMLVFPSTSPLLPLYFLSTSSLFLLYFSSTSFTTTPNVFQYSNTLK